MQIYAPHVRTARRTFAALALLLATVAASAADAARGIEQALAAAQQDKRGIVVYVTGQAAIAGAVTRIEPGQWVEMKNQTAGKVIVRLDRIDAIAAP